MEHLTRRWITEQTPTAWRVVVDDLNPWYICEVKQYLPGDKTGELTARAICNAHNASLKRKEPRQ